jgi:hypothetical protein
LKSEYLVGRIVMAERIGARLFFVAPMVVSGVLLAGCVSSPTYGTGKAADEQLLEDVTGILSLGPKDRPKIEYKPRPELVRPAATAGAGVDTTLPPPQENVTTASNGAWPESPEQTRARIRDEATANQDNDMYVSSMEPDVGKSKGITSPARLNDRGNFESQPDPDAQRKEFKKRLQETGQGSPTSRKYLSEPPLVYREASATAPVGDVGEDEWKKDRRAKRAAKKKGGGWWPW